MAKQKFCTKKVMMALRDTSIKASEIEGLSKQVADLVIANGGTASVEKITAKIVTMWKAIRMDHFLNKKVLHHKNEIAEVLSRVLRKPIDTFEPENTTSLKNSSELISYLSGDWEIKGEDTAISDQKVVYSYDGIITLQHFNDEIEGSGKYQLICEIEGCDHQFCQNQSELKLGMRGQVVDENDKKYLHAKSLTAELVEKNIVVYGSALLVLEGNCVLRGRSIFKSLSPTVRGFPVAVGDLTLTNHSKRSRGEFEPSNVD